MPLRFRGRRTRHAAVGPRGARSSQPPGCRRLRALCRGARVSWPVPTGATAPATAHRVAQAARGLPSAPRRGATRRDSVAPPPHRNDHRTPGTVPVTARGECARLPASLQCARGAEPFQHARFAERVAGTGASRSLRQLARGARPVTSNSSLMVPVPGFRPLSSRTEESGLKPAAATLQAVGRPLRRDGGAHRRVRWNRRRKGQWSTTHEQQLGVTQSC